MDYLLTRELNTLNACYGSAHSYHAIDCPGSTSALVPFGVRLPGPVYRP